MKAQARFTQYSSIALASLGLPAASSALQAQDFSGKPIRIIVGLSAGGATDVMARLVAAKMSETLNTPVTVENKTGGNFIPALGELTSSKPDSGVRDVTWLPKR
jgi:tripartite-type tricarboxylate transporter receptor subunit TctC